MFKNVPHVENEMRLHVKYLLNVNSLEIIRSSFLLLLVIKNAINNAVTAVVSLYTSFNFQTAKVLFRRNNRI